LNASAVLGAIQNLEIVYSNNGGIFIPPNINTIGEMDITQGYSVYCNDNSELVLNGQLVNPNTEYALSSNQWNWLGYPYNVRVSAEVALNEIEDQIVIVMTDDGRLYIPPSVNTLGNMIPGEGYLIFVSEDVTFQFQSEAILSASPAVQTQPTYIDVENGPVPTGKPYAALVSLTDEICSLDPAFIEVYDGDLLVGKALISENAALIPVICWEGVDEYNLPGFKRGHKANIIVKKADGTTLSTLSSPDLIQLGEGAFASASLETAPAPVSFKVSEAYPNPFNSSVTIPFTIPRNGAVRFILYDVLGREVARQERSYAAGQHRFCLNAEENVNNTGSGIYFINIVYMDRQITRKLFFIK